MYTLREAEYSDLDFIVDVIISAEKSMSDTVGLAKVFDISEEQLRKYFAEILSESIEGCEYSLGSFLVACYNDDPVGALGGWLEGHPDGITSPLLKSNLISSVFPREKILGAQKIFALLRPLQYEREFGQYQIEYAYIDRSHRGIGLPQELMENHIRKAKAINPDVKKVQVQPFENNTGMIKAHESTGFKVVKRYVSEDPDVLNYMPYHSKVLMEKDLKS